MAMNSPSPISRSNCWIASSRRPSTAKCLRTWRKLTSGVPVAGFVVTRARPGQVAPRDLADAWRLPCLATFPEHPALYDGLWHGRPSGALLAATEPLAQALTQEMAHPVNGRAKRAR
jgi:hypothetical protein